MGSSNRTSPRVRSLYFRQECWLNAGEPFEVFERLRSA